MEHVNPLRALREAAGLSSASAAEKAGITPQAVLRNEQAVYASPSDALLQTLWRAAPESDLHDYGILMADYHSFQRGTRQDSFGVLDPVGFFPVPAVGLPREHPFVAWRLFSDVKARIQISKKFCVHPATVFKFEAQPYLCASVPRELIRALLESGYDPLVLDRLEVSFGDYQDSKKSTSTESITTP